MLINGLSYNLDLWCIITRMWDLIWVSIQDFSKKAVFLAENAINENAINENARFSRKNGVMTFFDPKKQRGHDFFGPPKQRGHDFFCPTIHDFFYIFLYGSYFFLRKSCIFLCSVFERNIDFQRKF